MGNQRGMNARHVIFSFQHMAGPKKTVPKKSAMIPRNLAGNFLGVEMALVGLGPLDSHEGWRGCLVEMDVSNFIRGMIIPNIRSFR